MTTHKFQCRVYYEDTDMAGIVYYANYLRFIERARSEQVRELGIDQHEMKNERGLVFAVHKLEAEYKTAAKLDDLLTVETTLKSISGVRMSYQQNVMREDETLFASRVTVVCMNLSGRPVRFPADIRRKYEETIV